VPVPFRHDDDLERLGSAAFFRIQQHDDGFRGALFLVDARGEPVEFAYNRLELLQRFLWRPDQLRRHVARRLATSLFEICPRAPRIVLCRAEEVDAEVFAQEVVLSVPVARVADESALIGQAAVEQRELLGGEDGVQLFWVGSPPATDSPERGLVDELAKRGLLTEPFERATVGLAEVYGDEAERNVVE
jgi:hypothetical protein